MIGYWLVGISLVVLALALLTPPIRVFLDQCRLAKTLRRALLIIREHPLMVASSSEQFVNLEISELWIVVAFYHDPLRLDYLYRPRRNQADPLDEERLSLALPGQIEPYVIDFRSGRPISWRQGGRSYPVNSRFAGILALNLIRQVKEALARHLDQLVVRYSGGA